MKQFFNQHSCVYVSKDFLAKIREVKDAYEAKYSRAMTAGAIIEDLVNNDPVITELYKSCKQS